MDKEQTESNTNQLDDMLDLESRQTDAENTGQEEQEDPQPQEPIEPKTISEHIDPKIKIKTKINSSPSTPVERTRKNKLLSGEISQSCIFCTEPDNNYMLKCGKCREWAHYKCTTLPAFAIGILEDSKRAYDCRKCSPSREDLKNYAFPDIAIKEIEIKEEQITELELQLKLKTKETKQLLENQKKNEEKIISLTEQINQKSQKMKMETEQTSVLLNQIQELELKNKYLQENYDSLLTVNRIVMNDKNDTSHPKTVPEIKRNEAEFPPLVTGRKTYHDQTRVKVKETKSTQQELKNIEPNRPTTHNEQENRKLIQENTNRSRSTVEYRIPILPTPETHQIENRIYNKPSNQHKITTNEQQMQDDSPTNNIPQSTHIETLLINPEMMKHIIGKGGRKVKEIQNKTNTYIRSMGPGSNAVRIQGTAKNINQAKEEINQVITHIRTETTIHTTKDIPCRDYKIGYCRFGLNCKFSHLFKDTTNTIDLTKHKPEENVGQNFLYERKVPNKKENEELQKQITTIIQKVLQEMKLV